MIKPQPKSKLPALKKFQTICNWFYPLQRKTLLTILCLASGIWAMAQTCTLNNVVQSTAVCEGPSGAPATINLTGLAPSTSDITIEYTIDGIAQTPAVVISDASGTASFSTSNLTNGSHNGKILEITNVSITSPACSQAYTGTGKTVTLVVNPYLTPNVDITKNSTYICSGATPTFTATASNAGSPIYAWKVNNSNYGGNTATISPAGLPAGANSVEVTITSSESCTSSPTATKLLNFTVEALPNAPLAGPNEVCGPGSIGITATAGANETIDWYDAATNGNLLLSGNSNLTISNLSSTTTYYAAARNTTTGCVSASRTAVTATINPLPAALTAAQTTVSRCGAGSVTLSPTVPAGISVNWYNSTGTFIASGNTYSPTVSLGDTKFYAEAENNTTGCKSTSRLEFTVTANTVPADPSVTANSRCGTGTISLSATGAATLRWYNVSSGGTVLGTGSPFVTPSISATTNYWVESYNSSTGCTSNRVQVVATVNPQPATPTAGTAAAGICASGTTTLNATVPGGTTIDWFAAATGGSVLSGGSGTSSFTTPTISTTTTYYAEARDNSTGCVSASRLAVVATVNANPTAPSGSAAGTACGPNGTTSLSGTGAGANETYEWFTVASGGTAFATGASVTSPQLNANTTVYVQKKNTVTGCVSSRTPVNISWAAYVTPAVTVSASSSEICVNPGATVTFTANTTNSGTTPSFQWQSASSINGTYTNIAGANNSTYATTSLPSGTALRVILTSGATCASPASVTSAGYALTTYSTGIPNMPGNPNISVNPTSSLCPPANVTITSNAVSGTTDYLWTLPSGWTINSGNGTNNISVTVGAGTPTGSNVTFSLKVGNACGYDNSTKTGSVRISNYVGVEAGNDSISCSGQSFTLYAPPQGSATQVSWTVSPTSAGTFSNVNLNSGTTTFTPSTTGTFVFTAKTNTASGSCQGNTFTATDTRTVTVRPLPSATWGTAQTICEGNTATLTINNPNALAETVSYSIGGVAQTPVAVPANGSTNITTGVLTSSTTATITQVIYSTTPSCSVAPNLSSTITVNPKVNVSAGSPQTVCSNGTITLAGSITGGATTGTWSAPTGTFANASVLNTTYTPGKQSGTETLTLTSASPTSPCTVQSATVLISINQAPTVTLGSIVTPICQGSNFSLLSTTGGSTSSVTWTTNASGGSFANASAANTTYTPSTSAINSIQFVITTNDPDGAGPCFAASDTLNAFINPAAKVTAGSDATICSDGTVSLTGTSTGTSTTYAWTAPSGSFSPANNLTSTYTPTINSGSVVLTLTGADPDGAGPCTAATSSLTVTVQSKPLINNVGPDFTVCASATHSPITLGGVSLGGGATTGAWSITQGSGTLSNTSQTNNPSSVTFTPAANFSGVVKLLLTTNTSSACTTAATAERTITINAAPTVVAGSNQTICSDATVSLNAVITNATGGTWTSNGTGSFANANSTSTTYTPSADDINTGSVVLTFQTSGQTAPCTAVSSQLTVTINKKPTITSQPQNKIVCAGSASSFSVSASGTGLQYQWYKGTPGSGSLLGGQTSATLNIASAQASDAGSYYVVVSGTSPCASATSTAASLVVNQQITISSQPVASTVCQGVNTSLTVVASAGGDPLSFQWYKGNPGSGVAVTDGGNISGATSNTLSFTSPHPMDAGTYYAVISGPAGYTCGNITSNTALVTIYRTPKVVATPGSQTICSGSATSIALSDSTGTTFAWTVAQAGGVSGASNGSGTSIAQTLTTGASQGTATYTITPTSNGCTGTPVQVVVTVNPQPTNITYNPNANFAICSGSSPAINITSDIATTFTWTATATGVTGSSNGTASGTTASIATPLSVTTAPGTVQYVISNATAAGCSIASKTITVTVNPVPVVNKVNSKPSICSYAATNIQLSSPVAGATFAWTAAVTTAPTGGSITGFSAGTGASITQPLQNSGTTPGQVTYTLTATFAGCTGPSDTSIVTVNPLPQGDIDANISGGQTVCLNGVAPIVFTGSQGKRPYEFFYTINGGGSQSISTSQSTSTVSVNANTSTAGNVTFLLVGIKDDNSNDAACPQAVNPPKSAVVIVKPLPTANIAVNNSTICVGTGSSTVSLTGSSANGFPAPGSYTFTYNVDGGANQTITSTGTTATISVPNGTVGTKTYTLVSVAENGITPSCVQPQTGSVAITIQPNATITLSSAAGTNAQTVCVSNPVTNIQYTVGATGNGATVSGLPSGMTGSYNTGTKVFAISGSPAVSGTFNYTVTTTGTCGNVTATGTITVYGPPVGGTATNVSNLLLCSTANGGSINLSGQTGTIANWQSSTNGGLNWTNIASTSNPLAFTNIGQTTWYRAVVQRAGCSATQNAFSDYAVVSVVPPNGAGSLQFSTNPSPAVICTGSVALTANGFGSDTLTGRIYGGEFDNAGVELDGPGRWRKTLMANWDPQDKPNIEASTNNTDNSAFNLTNGPKTFPITCGQVTYNNNPLGGQVNNNKFMATVGKNTSSLESPIFSLIGLQTASFDWWQAYILTDTATITVELSFDGGVTYTKVLAVWGAGTYGNPLDFATASLNLNAYVGLSNLRIRFTYRGSPCSSWGLEKATITKGFGTPSYTWSLYNPIPAGGTPGQHYLSQFVNQTVISTPPTPNNTNAPQTYSYSISSSAGGCGANITVTVNPVLQTTVTNPNATICSDGALTGAISFGANVSGTSFSWTRATNTNVTFTPNTTTGTGGSIPANTYSSIVNNTSSTQTVTFDIIPTNANACSPQPMSTSIVIRPNLAVVLSGNQTFCGTGVQQVKLKSNGPFPITVTLSNGQTVTMNSAADSMVTLAPALTATGTVTLSSMTNPSCNAAPITGSATVTFTAGANLPVGHWAGGAGTCTTSGATSAGRDWFNPCNWGGGVIPTNNIDVFIIQSESVCDPIIDPTTSFAATNGPIARTRDITITGSTRNLSFANGGQLNVAGNWTNNIGPAGFTANTGTVVFMGNSTNTPGCPSQTIQTTAGNTETFYNLVVNNTCSRASTGDNVILNSPVNVSNVLTLTLGIVKTTTTNIMTVTNTATTSVVGGATTAYINGPLTRHTVANNTYNFPIGKPTGPYSVYRPATVLPNTGIPYTAEYFAASAPQLGNAKLDPLSILNTEYWNIKPTNGCVSGDQAVIGLQYIDPNTGSHWSGTAPSPCPSCDVAIAKPAPDANNNWYYTNWPNQANGLNTTSPEARPSNQGGWIYSKPVNCTAFGTPNFTFGLGYPVILPVNLLSFNGRLVNENAELTWTIADQADLAGFELEYSRDGRNFNKLSNVAPNGSNKFQYTHRNLSPGVHYYRLLMKNQNGNGTYSKTVMLVVGRNITIIKGMKATVVLGTGYVEIWSAATQKARVQIFDMTGRLLEQQTGHLLQGDNSLPVRMLMLPQGVYNLLVTTDDGVTKNLRLMKE